MQPPSSKMKPPHPAPPGSCLHVVSSISNPPQELPVQPPSSKMKLLHAAISAGSCLQVVSSTISNPPQEPPAQPPSPKMKLLHAAISPSSCLHDDSSTISNPLVLQISTSEQLDCSGLLPNRFKLFEPSKIPMLFALDLLDASWKVRFVCLAARL